MGKKHQKHEEGADKVRRDAGKACEDKITISKEEYETLKRHSSEKEHFYDKYLRAHAEFENALKRLQKEREAFVKYANEGLIVDFLPIVDSLEMAERHIKEARDFDAVRQGVDMIHGQIQRFLRELGVERVKSVGEKFDPNVHDVIEAATEDGGEDDTVVEELKPGYKLNGKLLRPASVKVVRKKEE